MITWQCFQGYVFQKCEENGDLDGVKKALELGAPVNATNEPLASVSLFVALCFFFLTT